MAQLLKARRKKNEADYKNLLISEKITGKSQHSDIENYLTKIV